MFCKPHLIIALTLILLGCGSGPSQFQGYVEGEYTLLSSPYSGILEHLAIMRGQEVKKGQLIFQLDPKPQSLVIAQLQEDLQQAKNTLQDIEKPRRPQEIAAIQAQIQQVEAQIILAQLRVKRNETLYKRQAGDKDTLDAAIARLQEQEQLKAQYQANLALAQLGNRADQILAQQAQVKSLQSKLQQAQWDLQQKTLYAPASGLIFDTYYNTGEFVAPQQPVAALLTPQNVRIEFFIPVDEVRLIHLGEAISFSCMGCSENNQAVINYIAPEAEYLPPLVYSRNNADKLVFRIKAHIKDGLKFKPGQPVTVNLP